MRLSVIAPTYNEAANVRPLIAQLQQVLTGLDYEILIADDDSPDRTWEIVERMGQENPRIRVLRRRSNRGLGAAVVEAFSAAAGEAVACIDADLQHDPSILPKMFDALNQGADLVVGSRYVEGGGTGDWNGFRRFGSRSATRLAQALLGVKLSDPMSGYFMLRRADFLKVRETLNPDGFKILLEIAARLKPRRVDEVAYVFRPRTAGESKLSSKIVAAYLRQLWRLSPLGRLLPTEFVKYGIVGGIGVVVNLAVMSLIITMTRYRDWRASALATLVATINNYVLNNVWTFRDRSHTGFAFVHRYAYFLFISLLGMAATAGTYSAIIWFAARIQHLSVARLPTFELLLAQMVGITTGTLINYELNRHITWPAQPGA